VIRALFFLRTVSLGNQLAAAAKRLRQPKYLVSSVAGLAYFYFMFLRRIRVPAAALPGVPVPSEAITTMVAALLLLVLFLRTALGWHADSAEARLRFSEPEVAFLFAAPLSRRRLIHFHLLGSQLMILFTSVVITFVFNRWSFLGGNALTHAVGWWIILSTFALYGNALRFVSARVQQVFGPEVRRKVLGVLALLAALLVRRCWTTAESPPELLAGTAAAGMAEYLAHWIETAVRPVVLYPFAAVVAPFTAPTTRAFLLALGPSLVLPALCYAAILGLEVPFREGSLASAQKRAEFVAARRSGAWTGARLARPLKARKAPFALTGRGRPEIAFLWKNLIGIQSWFNWRVVPVILLMGAFFIFSASRNFHGSGAALRAAGASVEIYAPLVLAAAAFGGFYVMLLGPQLLRQDLRSDLLNADLLKAYPLPGWQIVLGQMLTPAMILAALLWCFALAFGWVEFCGYRPALAFTAGTRLTLLGCVAAAVPPVVLLQLVIPNAAALLFPAWHQSSRARSGGVEAIGQRLIFTFGQFIMVVLALLPAIIVAGLIGLASAGWSYLLAAHGNAEAAPASHVFALLIATLGGLVIVSGEVWVGLWWLGRRFDRLDIASELKP
jgi:hypothetical protein